MDCAYTTLVTGFKMDYTLGYLTETAITRFLFTVPITHDSLKFPLNI